MAGILDFDASALDALLARWGIRKTWLSLLATSFRHRDDLAYILDSPEFADFEVLDTDLLNDLSIGEISVLYEYSVAILDPEQRKANGQYFTPDDVAELMAGYAGRFPEGRWLDPCSGVGNLSWHLTARQTDPEEFLLSRLIVCDKDDLALLVARALITASFQSREPLLFNEIKSNFVVLDFLAVRENSLPFEGAPTDLQEHIPAHDFVIVNPPYLSTAKDERFETGAAGDLYAYFLENIIKTSVGFVSITPQSFTNAKKFRTLRSLLLRHYSNLTILAFDNIPGNIFRGIKFGSKNSNSANSMRAAITIAMPGLGQPRITSLMRWRGNERSRVFTEVERYLSSAPLTDEFFPKVSAVFQDLYHELDGSRTLGTFCVGGKTEFPLYVPSAPRYFIPALKTPAARASQKTVYFASEADRDLAYLAINSSLMYWWWRVRDGGMTLSQNTLLSLPLPEFEVDHELVRQLEHSEKTNKVYKQNAGAAQENVKHPPELLARLNALVAPDFAERLLITHENSEFVQAHFLVESDDRVTEATRSKTSTNGGVVIGSSG